MNDWFRQCNGRLIRFCLCFHYKGISISNNRFTREIFGGPCPNNGWHSLYKTCMMIFVKNLPRGLFCQPWHLSCMNLFYLCENYPSSVPGQELNLGLQRERQQCPTLVIIAGFYEHLNIICVETKLEINRCMKRILE